MYNVIVQGEDLKRKVTTFEVLCVSDKDGRDPVSTLALPSKKKHPEYYTVIENPTDFQIIEKNIFSGAYADLEAFDKDMNTLFKNAEVGKYKSTEVTVKNFMLSFIFEFCIPYTKFFPQIRTQNSI